MRLPFFNPCKSWTCDAQGHMSEPLPGGRSGLVRGCFNPAVIVLSKDWTQTFVYLVVYLAPQLSILFENDVSSIGFVWYQIYLETASEDVLSSYLHRVSSDESAGAVGYTDYISAKG